MRPRDAHRAKQLQDRLESFETVIQTLPGLAPAGARMALVEQLVESIRRVRFVTAIASRAISKQRLDPRSTLFDPIRAAVLQKDGGHIDEAAWLVFLSVHFGRHRTSGWRLVRDVYGKLGAGDTWTWPNVTANPVALCDWFATNEETLRGGDGVTRRFGNHRKYESLSAKSPRAPCVVIKSYIDWVGPARSHAILFDSSAKAAGGDPRSTFAHLFQSMAKVTSFGRTATFDYLSMIGKTQIATIEPDSPYLIDSTGPLRGAKLLFGGSSSSKLSPSDLDKSAVALGNHLGVDLQVVEDALCNWQKAPTEFVPFRG